MKKIIYALLISLILPCLALADDSSLGRYGETVRPIQNSSIRMESEKINVKVLDGYSLTTCSFKFVNLTNKSQSVLMGFPDGADSMTKPNQYAEYDSKITQFTTVIDGKNVSVKHEKGKMLKDEVGGWDYPYWYSWDISFKPNETKTIINTYRTKNTVDVQDNNYTGYIITTGAPWAGTIKDAEIVFDFSNFGVFNVYSATPTNYKFNGDKLVWHFTDFEPTSNINVLVNKNYNKFVSFCDDYNNADLMKSVNTVSDLYSKGDYTNAIKEADNVLTQYNLTDKDELNYFLIKKASSYVKLGKMKTAIPIFEKVVSSNVSGNYDGIVTEAAYYLMNYYKTADMKKAQDIYRSYIFKKTNAVFQKWVNEQIFSRTNSSFFTPQITKCVIKKDTADVYLLDQDGDFKDTSLAIWYVKDGKKVYLVNEKEKITRFATIDPFYYCYRWAYTTPNGINTLYYKVYAQDYSNHVLYTDVKTVKIQ